ncbi:MAG TPA: DUF2946 family protein [Azospirillum sp.]|nr:DUF2946 family protein [Azospirillum sp.]
MRLPKPSARTTDAVPAGTWRRLAAGLAVLALLAQTALTIHAYTASAADDLDEICSVMPAAGPAQDGTGSAGGQPAAKPVHCPVCTAAPGAVAPPPPALALAPPPPLPAAERLTVVSFDVVQPPYMDGPPGHAPPARA